MTENEKLDLILQKISGLDEKVEGIDKRVSGLDEKVEGIDKRVSGLDEKVEGIDKRVSGLDEKMDGIDKRVSSLETDMKEVRQQVTKTNLVLENEIRVNIQRVAEGHLDLSRNLHDAMRPSNEVEMLAIKVRMLESDVQELKRKIS